MNTTDPIVTAALDRFEAAFREAIREPLRDLVAELGRKPVRPKKAKAPVSERE